VAGFESKINILGLAEAPDEETGDNEQHQRTCYLSNDERAADELATATTRGTPGTVV
jgi:hypothetical protein